MRRLLTVLLCSAALASCQRRAPEPPPTPTPSPTPSPTATPVITPPPTPTPSVSPTPPPITYLPNKNADVGRLFNGVTFSTKFVTPSSEELASTERVTPGSYEVEITFKATLPRASQSLEDFAKNDPKLPHVLNQMASLVGSAQVSPFFERLYKIKVNTLRDQLFALDSVLTRHNFYDCETMLELKSPDTQRKALLMIGDMDVNVDGSDGDRNVTVDDSGRFFQPQTSYRWPKQTDRVNPQLTKAQQKLADLKKEYATPGLSAARNKELQGAIDHTTRTINDLKSFSFLISATDPSIVVPSFMLNDSQNAYSPKIGDYAVVIYDGVIYPTIVGDAGPSAKIGEASVRLGKQINPKASAISRSVSNIKVAYLIFPGTAEKAGPPDLAKWTEMCKKYLDEIGGSAPELFVWEDIVPPWPTPTPTPTPEPSPSPAPAVPGASPSLDTTPAPGTSPAASTTPAPEAHGGVIVQPPAISPGTTPLPPASTSPEPTTTAPEEPAKTSP